ncbi:MAG TPA: type I-D CRISPR-associated helicase Cas3' [Ktedonobacteraceae bacterium]|nr:type I-D CRISPR-associated helicase Cas3' [Ktedonobacteraceae bacterium]
MSPINLVLQPQYEHQWRGENPSPATFNTEQGQFPLYHQWCTYNATEPIIVNTYNTGTGKTKAALLRLLKRARDIGFSKLDSSEPNALLIAPTNELLAQHTRDARKFCDDNNLPYRVVPISRADLDNYKETAGFSESYLRRGAALHAIIQNARRIDTGRSKKATLFVVNPDIFYYAFYFCYGKNDRIPLFQDFLSQFNYIIIDEFHYYSPKQFANFLFFMSLSKHYGFMSDSNPTGRQFCILTATPNEKVKQFLKDLGVKIGWIVPNTNSFDGLDKMHEVPALTPVHLDIYSIEDMKDGLLTLAQEQRREIKAWLDGGDDGAIISSALWRINQVYYGLKSIIPPDIMGRLTGAESSIGRSEAKDKRLILATPTVDIGYNFDRAGKPRQNIDFLLLDARSGDEFIQRLGRAGRILGKKQQDIPSHVMAVVDPAFYKALQAYDGQTLSRLTLRQLAEENLPARNNLYSYIRTGAIAEAFLPIYRLEGMASAADKPDLQDLFNEVQQIFAADTKLTYEKLRGITRKFIYRSQDYGGRETFPAEMNDCLKACEQRLRNEQEYRKKRGQKLWLNAQDAYKWLQQDLRSYFLEKARFSFREAFQPPLALVSDSKGLLSSEPVALFDALHIVKNYKVEYYSSLKEWQQQLSLKAPEGADDALIFCDLVELLPPEQRLQLGLKLSVGNYKRTQWEEEERFAYYPTALYSLEVTVHNNHHGLPAHVRKMFSERYIPAFVVGKDSRSASTMWLLQRQAQFFPYDLQVTFGDARTHEYYAVLGSMALQVGSEIPYRDIARDIRKVQSDDDALFIF